MKQKFTNKILTALKTSFLVGFLFVEFFSGHLSVSAANPYDCTAGVVFNVTPSTITDAQSVTISGSISANTIAPRAVNGEGQCTYPNTSRGVTVSQYYVSIHDLNSDKDIIFISNTFNLPTTNPTSKTSYSWSLPAKTISANDISALNTTSLNLVAVVKVTDGTNWNTLTQSAPIAIQVARLFGCPDANTSVYTCASSQTDPGLAACPRPLEVVSPPDKCGCTQDEYKAGCKNGVKSIPPPASLKTNGVTCDDSSECKSNYCSETTGKCQACSDYTTDVCNTNGDEGFACTAGVCVKPDPKADPAATGVGQSGNSATTLYNPIPGSEDITQLLLNIMKGFLGIIGVWAVAFITIGGFKLVGSQGDEEGVTAAKKTITWAVLGLLAAVFSFAIIAIVQNLLGIKVPPPATPPAGTTPTTFIQSVVRKI